MCWCSPLPDSRISPATCEVPITIGPCSSAVETPAAQRGETVAPGAAVRRVARGSGPRQSGPRLPSCLPPDNAALSVCASPSIQMARRVSRRGWRARYEQETFGPGTCSDQGTDGPPHGGGRRQAPRRHCVGTDEGCGRKRETGDGPVALPSQQGTAVSQEGGQKRGQCGPGAVDPSSQETTRGELHETDSPAVYRV